MENHHFIAGQINYFYWPCSIANCNKQIQVNPIKSPYSIHRIHQINHHDQEYGVNNPISHIKSHQTTIKSPINHHWITIKSPINHHWITTKSPISHHWIPLNHRQTTFKSPLNHHQITIESPWNQHQTTNKPPLKHH